jgi:hypothetical protein
MQAAGEEVDRLLLLVLAAQAVVGMVLTELEYQEQ